jgi:nucleoside-diphosphate-sugar epimerase
MRILLTGADGYIGAVLGPMLLARGHKVVGLDAGYYRAAWLFEDGQRRPETVTKDIRQIEAADVAGFDAVVHLAELSNDPLGEHDPRTTYDINHRGSVGLARAAKAAGVPRFVYASSCSVYGAAADGSPRDETSPTAPQTAYAKCKIMVEEDVRALADDRFTPVFLRNATAFGASPRMRFDIVLNNLAGLAWTTREIRMTSDGTPLRPLIHVQDISLAAALALEAPRDRVHGESFNVGDDSQNYRIRDIAEIVARNFPGCAVTFGSSNGDNRSYRVSFEKIRRHLPDFRCAWDAEAGARQLRAVFERISMTQEIFAASAYTRLKQLKHLLQTGQIDAEFYVRPPEALPGAESARETQSTSVRDHALTGLAALK